MKKSTVIKIAAATTAVGLMAAPALATTSTDADFNGFATKITGWLTGSLGKTIGYVGVGVGAVSIVPQSVGRRGWMDCSWSAFIAWADCRRHHFWCHRLTGLRASRRLLSDTSGTVLRGPSRP